MNDDIDRFGMPGYGAHTYGDAFADVYDHWYADLDDDDFVDTVLAALPASGARVLDLGTGTGRLLERIVTSRPETAAPSDDLTGVDSSEAMLALARRHPVLAAVTLVHGDFSVALPDGPFHVVMAGYNTLFNLPDDDALSACMGLVAGVLGETGRFIVDCVMPPRDGGGDHVGVRTITATEVVLSVTRHDAGHQRITGQFVQFTESGGVRLRPWSVRYVSPERLDEIAAAQGLALVARHGGHGDSASRHVSTYSRRS